MATIDSKDFIDRLIAGNGLLDGELEDYDNPPAIKIVEYTNAYGTVTWGVVFKGESGKNRYEIPTDYVRNPKVIWERKKESVVKSTEVDCECHADNVCKSCGINHHCPVHGDD